MNTQNNKLIQGFTLIELSIVIIIIGFLIAGVSAGQSLVESAKMNRLISQLEEYKVSMNMFYSRYNAVPGDFASATAFWPGQTVNGNGNGIIGTNSVEESRAWQHLLLSGFVTGSFNGVSDLGCGCDKVGVTIPQTPYPDAGFNLASIYGNGDGGWTSPVVGPQHVIWLAGDWPAGGEAILRVFSPLRVSILDNKIDDSRPLTGNVTVAKDFAHPITNDANCFTDIINYLTADYNVTYEGKACKPIIKLPIPTSF